MITINIKNIQFANFFRILNLLIDIQIFKNIKNIKNNIYNAIKKILIKICQIFYIKIVDKLNSMNNIIFRNKFHK